MTHSVLPWFLGEDVFDQGEEAGFNGTILSVDKTEPEPEPYEVARHVDKQDADMIIRAVNSHADLVAALEDGIRYIEATVRVAFLKCAALDLAEDAIASHSTLQKMRSALAKAKGE